MMVCDEEPHHQPPTYRRLVCKKRSTLASEYVRLVEKKSSTSLSWFTVRSAARSSYSTRSFPKKPCVNPVVGNSCKRFGRGHGSDERLQRQAGACSGASRLSLLSQALRPRSRFVHLSFQWAEVDSHQLHVYRLHQGSL